MDLIPDKTLTDIGLQTEGQKEHIGEGEGVSGFFIDSIIRYCIFAISLILILIIYLSVSEIVFQYIEHGRLTDILVYFVGFVVPVYYAFEAYKYFLCDKK